ncbi:hypothetical protein [Vibrio sp. MEBiC08052]|uniref:hypothetical protein n=1 Tax=Vibrio sp. MEBiC08052 TaxID=1761910 RepID=UPI0007405848|nr:hypothetical protein [Vibrio sp. MEBiC08052]KUI98945.1 hypothetical protein VRK_19460 [Vibrio sp. MEBiC08052]
MSKVSIVYIGPKAFKRDTVSGTRQVFPRMTPIEVEVSVAANLLRFEQVFIEAEKLDDVLSQKAEQEQAQAEALADEEYVARQQIIDADFTVMVGDKPYDLKKMNSPKIAALLEGADMLIDDKGAQESAEDYRLRVRNTIRAMQDIGEGESS